MIGILWYDADTKTTLEQKIQRALDYHKHRMERDAQVVLINPKMADGIDLASISTNCKATVKAVQHVILNHFWVGFEDQAMELQPS